MSKTMHNILVSIYEKHSLKLLIIPVILLIVSIGIVGNHYLKTGEFVSKGVSLKGGTTISIAEPLDVNSLESHLRAEFPGTDVGVRSIGRVGAETGVIIEVSDVTGDDLLAAIEKETGTLNKDKYTIDVTGSSLGESFFKQALIALGIALLLISCVVYLYFRAALPSFYAVFSVVANTLFAMAMCVVFDVKLATAGIAAFLMLIGYSIDTDILLTTRVLKRKEGSVSERMTATIKTGLTMIAAALSSVVVGLLLSESELLRQILFILGWGLVGDVIYTWLFNAVLLQMYVKKKEGQTA